MSPDARLIAANTVPVGWVAQMLDELFAVAAQCEPQPVAVGDKIMSIRAQLAQFAPKECGVVYHNTKMGRDHTCGLPVGHAGEHQCNLCAGQWVDAMAVQEEDDGA